MNLANRITLARIFLVPIIMFFLLVKLKFPHIRIEHFSITYNQIIAALIFIIAASTDSLDGYIARKRKLVTNLGKLLDPLADKLLVSAVLVSLVEMDKLDAWIAIVIISREFAVTGLRQIALLEGIVMAASKWGKWKTATQITAIIALLINNFPFALLFNNFRFDIFASWIAALITIYSGIDYFIKNKHVINFTEGHNSSKS
jgi:CDP-diacylglycerol--glycerol-3-phosphate 3-phosphatidyltransferase